MALRRSDTAACDHAMRLLVGNRLPLALLADAVGLTADVAAAIAGGEVVPLWPGERDWLGVLIAILVRLEIRLGHDPARVRRALATPLAALGDRTPVDVMTSDGLAGLRLVHRAAGELQLPAERWWRIAPRR